jgi:Fe2+ or Zn2+ uptake regulation protein
VAVVDQGDRQKRYKHVGLEPPHFHLVCSRCGKVWGVPLAEGARFASGLESRRGFHVDLSHVTLPGLCEECS